MSFLHGSRGAARFGWCVAAAAVLAGCGLSVDGVSLRTRVTHDGATAGDTLVTQDDRGTGPDEGSVDGESPDAADDGPTPDVIEGEVVSLDVVEAGGDDGGADALEAAVDVPDDALVSDAPDGAEADARCSGDSECPDGGHCSGGTCVYDAGGPSEASVDVPVAMDAADAATDAPDGVAPPDVTEAGLDAGSPDGSMACSSPCPVPNGFRDCVGGVCATAVVCSLGFANCNGFASDGCETTAFSDENNCGACGTRCAAGQLCVDGSCGGACRVATQTVCTTTMGVGCFDLATDPRHCGSCDGVCATGQSCVGGMCQCPSGARLCGGVCVNTQSNANHCGACGVQCGGGGACRDGACACSSGQTACADGANFTCVSTQNNARHCGACGNVCTAPTTACVAGACACSDAGKMPCSGACVPRNDPNNCGACGNVCPMNTVCGPSVGGGATTIACRCASGVRCEGVCALAGTFVTCTNGIVCRSGRCPLTPSSMRCLGDTTPCTVAAAGG